MKLTIIGGSQGTGAELAQLAHQVGDGRRLGGTISRADLAAYLLEVLSDDSMVGRAVGISS